MEEFERILREHRARYPLMEPQDYGKLAFQSEFGPEHMVTDREAVERYLRQEWRALPETERKIPPEPIGNGLCRLHLAACGEDSLPVLAELFCRSAREHRGSREGLERRVALLQALEVPGMEAWLAQYRAEGYPPVHHSRSFREHYAPHYRVICASYAEEIRMCGDQCRDRLRGTQTR